MHDPAPKNMSATGRCSLPDMVSVKREVLPDIYLRAIYTITDDLRTPGATGRSRNRRRGHRRTTTSTRRDGGGDRMRFAIVSGRRREMGGRKTSAAAAATLSRARRQAAADPICTRAAFFNPAPGQTHRRRRRRTAKHVVTSSRAYPYTPSGPRTRHVSTYTPKSRRTVSNRLVEY